MPVEPTFEVTESLLQYLPDVQAILTGIQFDIGRHPSFNRLVDTKLPAANLDCAADAIAFLPSFRTCDQQVGAELARVERLSRDPYDLADACGVDDGDEEVPVNQQKRSFWTL